MAPAAHTPWLLAGACDLSSPLLLRDYAVRTFGELAAATLPTEAAFYTGPSAPLSHTEWQRALAEELLLAHILGATLPHIILKLFHHIAPLDTCPLALDELLGRRAAVTMIPLDGGSHAPSCAHLWLIEDPRAPRGTLPGWASLPAACEIRGSRFAIHTVCARPPTAPIAGESYQLALWLLQQAIDHDDQNAIRSLALNWIISGRITAVNVQGVELGNKLQLNITRRWLLPRDNKRRITLSDALYLEFAASLTTAWNIVTNAGLRFEGVKDWPKGVRTLHSFVSMAREPVIASILLTQPCEVVLWHSGGSWQQSARDMARIIHHFLPDTHILVKRISSSNLLNAELTLRKALPHAVNDHNPILFNITQGNRLMMFAALAAAQHNPSVWLIYRDFDAPPFAFTMICYEDRGVPHTYVLRGHARAKTIKIANWNKLFPRPKARVTTPASQFIEHISLDPCQKMPHTTV